MALEQQFLSQFSALNQNISQLVQKTASITTLQSYTVASAPATAATGAMIYVTDEAGGAVPAFFDGSAWRRVTDRNVIS
jgi:hypothetical protein